MSMKLFLATGNAHKVAEFSRMFAEAGLDVEVVSAREAGGMPEVEENAGTFEGNALLKAEALAGLVGGEWVLADDSGLAVDALGGAPGVRSARYAGENATDGENRAKLLREMAGVADGERRGRFVCVLALAGPGRREVFRGECEGEILREERGLGGFGYDPVFRPEGFGESFAEMPAARKNELSHRGKAMAKLVEWMRGEGR